MNRNHIVSREIRSRKNWTLFIILLIYVIFVGCRSYNVGADTIIYATNVQMASEMSLVNYLTSKLFIDPVFCVYTWIISSISKNPTVFFIISSFLYFVVFLKIAVKYADKLGWSIWIFNAMGFTTLALSNVRQALAIALCLLTYFYLERAKWKSVILVLLACGTHGSAIIFIPMLFVGLINKRNLPILLAIILAVVSFLGPAIMTYLGSSYAIATGKEIYEEADEAGVGGIGMIIYLVVLLLMGVITYFPTKENRPESYYNEYLAVGLALVVFIISRFNQGTMRLFWFYLVFSCMYIPNVIGSMKKNNRFPWVILLIAVTVYYLFTKIMNNPYEESRLLLPYTFIWQ